MLRMISSELNLNQFTVYQILTQDLDIRKVCTKMVPKNLTTEQKANRRQNAKVGNGTLQTLPIPRKRE